VKQAIEKATDEAANKIRSGESPTLEDINFIRERALGLPPKQQESA